MTGNLPLHISAQELASRVAAGDVSAHEVAEAFLARVDELNPPINAIVWRDDPATRAAADRVDADRAAGHPLGPLAGVPMTIKDVLAVAGQPCTSSSTAIDEAPATESALVVDAALDAGLVPLGRAASPELAMTTSCESDRWGVTRNPWDRTRSPGGSSGGSAAAVAAGLVPVALASDGGGSIRVPAAFCGVVGLKPSRGLLPSRTQGWAGGSVEGAITRSVTDAALVYGALARPDRHAWAPQPMPAPDYLSALDRPAPRLRIGLTTTALDPAIAVDDACAAAAADVADRLRAHGHEVVHLEPIPAMAEVMDIYPRTIIPAWLTLLDVARPELLPAHVRRHLEHGRSIDVTTYLREVALFQRDARTISAYWFDQVDVVVTPTTATRVPVVGHVRDELLAGGGPTSRSCTTYEQTLAFTTVPSVVGSPAISLPTHVDDDGLPLGVQLVGRPFSETLLLQLGRDLERTYAWLERCPSGL